MNGRVASVIAAVALAIAGCAPEAPEKTPGLLFPIDRMLDGPAPGSASRVAWGDYVRIAGEERPAIAASREGGELVQATPPAPGEPPGRWSLRLPAADAPWLLVQPGLQTGSGLVQLPPRLVAPRASGAVIVVDAGDTAAQADGRMLALVTPLSTLESRDVVGRPFVVPRGAVLAVGMGVDEPAWTTDAAPVEFRVAVLEQGRETIVHRTALDPARRAEDRRWVDARIDLAAFAGRTVALALRTAITDAQPAGTSLPVWADPTVLAPRATPVPNVVLISLDTLRAKSVSAYGSPRPTTPYLDRLIGDAGTIFDFAYTSAPHTLPAHLSTFTGLHVRDLRGTNPVRPLPRDVPTLPERLRAAGYETAAVTEDGFVLPGVGFRRGFASYRENTSPNVHGPLGHSAMTFRAAADWLGTHRDRPTFVFAHTYEVHFPYTPAPPYDTAFGAAADAGGDTNAVEQLLYEQEARHLDDELHAFLDAVDALGLGTRTLVVVMGDHGEEFGEHGSTRHGFQLYDEAIHVPLMMRLPGVVPAGRRVATPVSLVDVTPTILDLVGAPPLIGADGVSLRPLFAGGALPEHRRAVFTEASSSLLVGVDLLSVQMPGIHCIYRTRRGTSECFDTARDPDQRAPVGDDDARVDAAREQAIEFLRLRPAPPAPTVPDELVRDLAKHADAERLEKLRSLGYVQ